MFTTQDVIIALLLGLIVGAFAGAVAWEVLVAGPLRRERAQARARIRWWQLRAFLAGSRATARAYAVMGHPEVLDNDRWSKNGDRATVRSVS